MVTSRIWFTPAQKAELWARWKQGQCITSISRALERRSKTGVQRIISLHGGIAPSLRRTSARALRLEEREEISRGIAAGRKWKFSARSVPSGADRFGPWKEPSGLRESGSTSVPIVEFQPLADWSFNIRGIQTGQGISRGQIAL
jgi:hypothetical protein